MLVERNIHSGSALDLLAEADLAIARIPPAFPLSATVAVNPFLGQCQEDRATAAARLERVGGIRVARPRAEIAEDIAAGKITKADLAAAAAAAGIAPQALRSGAEEAAEPVADPTVADLAAEISGIDWPTFLSERIGLWASGYFDEGQAFWASYAAGPYAAWRAFAQHDLTPEIAGLSGFARRVADLPNCSRTALAEACAALGIGAEEAPVYFHRLLMTLGGWAQLARARGWTAERDGGSDDTAFALLTIRVIWEAALHDAYAEKLAVRWAAVRDEYAGSVVAEERHVIDAALQDATDRAAERQLAATLASEVTASELSARPAIQAAFCIDVRSEVFRRALEAANAKIETIGFAGFFGIATEHRCDASDVAEARGPILLTPAQHSCGGATAEADQRMRLVQRAVRAWGRFRQAAVSAFAFVEAAGPIYGVKLAKNMRRDAVEEHHGTAPKLDLPIEQKIASAAGILRAMSLAGPTARPLARLVLIAGHGAHVTNTPHASALQCGACGGHAGDVNARLLAGVLNDPAVRDGLVGEGIEVPTDTLFVAGMHDTVSDRLTIYEDGLRESHDEDLAMLREALAKAGALARAERAVTLSRASDPETLLRRGGDWAELRQEWGLAGCAAFIAAPRHRTAGRDLGGRAFLHSYEWQADDEFGILELILTAPVVVASWIALQYHGSRVAPEAFGGGNKLLHNVVGGVGVVEGNGGLLRAGLPMQSVHDGETWRHEAVRLAVVVEAPTEAISGVLTRHPDVRALFDNGWLSLHAMDSAGRMAHRYSGGDWIAVEGGEERRAAA